MAIPLLGSFEEIDDASSLASLSMENSLHMDTLFSRQTIDPQHETDKGQFRSSNSRVTKSSLFGKFLLTYVCNLHVLSNLLLIYICKLQLPLN